MKKKLITAFALIYLLSGCEDLERPNTEQFVVEGFLTADFPIDDIKIKETVSLNDEIMDIPITSADVRIISEESSTLLTYNSETGKYYDEAGDWIVQIDAEYEIEITVDGTTATSSSNIPEKPTGLDLSVNQLVIPSLTLNFGLRDQIVDLFENEIATLTWQGVEGRSYFVVIESTVETIDPVLPSGIPEETVELISSFRFISEHQKPRLL